MRMSKLKNDTGSFVSFYLSIIITWIIAFFFLFSFQMVHDDPISHSHLENARNLVLSGFFSGVIWATIYKLGQRIKVYLPFYFMSVLVSISGNILTAYLLMYGMYHMGDFFSFDKFPRTFSQLIELYNSQLFYAILIYLSVVGGLIEIFVEVDKKFGKGTLLKFLLGRYYKPKEEERVFLFMDLKSSTHYAEKLGHFKYSRLIQDCFKDISSAVTKNKAEIYQFVGDEVVLTWKLKDGVRDMNCIQVFYDFLAVLDKRQDYYQKHYGMVPVFKAGVHAGKVMVAEVGELKMEIAYHGDAINTASRIQGLCNSYDTRLLVSESLIEELKKKNQLNGRFFSLGEILLNGKQFATTLYRVN